MSSPMAAQRQRLDGRTARPDASHGNTNRMRRYLWAAALLGAGGLLLRRDRCVLCMVSPTHTIAAAEI